jgi:ABC-type polysaccharide/polyol phosphate transport system ATPase subunit
MPGVAIEARSLSKQFILRHNRSRSIKSRVMAILHEREREQLELFWALRDISLTIAPGERVGLIGRNGSGKSTLLKLIAGIHRPTSGQLLVAERATIGSMIELGVGFHPDLTGTENVYLNAAIHGRSRAEIDGIYPGVVEYSGLERFMDVALKNYSSGMHMRLGFAIAANLNPDIILLDEVFAVGDEDFQKKCLQTMERFASEGRTIIFVSHSMSAVRKMCRRACVLDAGRLRFDGDVDNGVTAYHKLLADPGAGERPAEPIAPAAVEADIETRTRRQMSGWAFDVLAREGFTPEQRIIEVGIEPAADPLSPLLRHVGSGHYAYWQVGDPSEPALDRTDIAIAATVLVHFPLHTIARIIATIVRQLAPGGRFYATFYEAPRDAALTPKSWPGGFVTSPDAVPYQYSFEMIEGLASAFGATTARVNGANHPNGETTIVIVK